MVDWSEGHHELNRLVKELYDFMLWNRTKEAKKICDEIVVIARLTKAQIGAQEKEDV